MGFDWGSFTGGAVGALGAYLAARYAFSLSQKRTKEQLAVETAVSIGELLRGRLVYLHSKEFKDDPTFENMKENVTVFLEQQMVSLLPKSIISGDKELLKIIRELREFGAETTLGLSFELSKREIPFDSKESIPFVIAIGADINNTLAIASKRVSDYIAIAEAKCLKV
ncbi:hypothetical protein CIG75_12845 [Tumebacillus algifaecis]|uniref:Uncharacterized protein n=1 Tax=Tumebacillus algifaecis TaxID=1214604 RepID=A0A223D327_9BACL|nr:hypothetical protein [Tumebacillus algifaecis]ASS75786.1 hypothetical protein CIG75_12845 [Tumebacillus algifaecis]